MNAHTVFAISVDAHNETIPLYKLPYDPLNRNVTYAMC